MLLSEGVANRVWAFLSAYVVVFVLLWLLRVATGVSIEQAFYAIASYLSNVGTGFGSVASSFSGFHKPALWVLVCAMLIGRLDVFTVLLLLSPNFCNFGLFSSFPIY